MKKAQTIKICSSCLLVVEELVEEKLGWLHWGTLESDLTANLSSRLPIGVVVIAPPKERLEQNKKCAALRKMSPITILFF